MPAKKKTTRKTSSKVNKVNKETEDKVQGQVLKKSTPEVKNVVPQQPSPEVVPSETDKPSDNLFKTSASNNISEPEIIVESVPHTRRIFWIVVPSFLLGMALVSAVFMFRQGIMIQFNKLQVVDSSPTTQEEASPSTTLTLDLSKYSIKVLNGSGIRGEAAKAEDILTENGFTVGGIGNAERSNYSETIIQAQKDVDPEFLENLKTVLGKTYVVGENQELTGDETDEVIVIIGKSKVEVEESPTT